MIHTKHRFKLFMNLLTKSGLSLLLLFSMTCNPEKQYKKNPYLNIIRHLQTKTIVGLGDFYHGNAYPFQTAIKTISTWLAHPEFDIQSLTLCLEEDSVTVNKITEYIRTGNWHVLFDYFLPFTILERFEFYNDLRKIYLKVDSLNQSLPENKIIHFNILGAEYGSGIYSDTLLNMDAQTSKRYFVQKRDSFSAQNILSYFEKNPATRILLFYGTEHLLKKKSKKPFVEDLDEKDQYEYYLGYYLHQKLRENYLAIAQTPYPRNLHDPKNEYYRLIDEDLFFESSAIPWKVERYNPNDYDAMIFLSSKAIDANHLVRFIFSRKIIESAIIKMEYFDKFHDDEFGKRFYNRSLESLNFVTWGNFKIASAWKEWYARTKYDGVSYLESNEFAERMYSEFNNPKNRRKLWMFGFPDDVLSIQTNIDKSEWHDHIWRKALPIIKFQNAVGIYWFGFPDEQIQAKQILINFSKKDFDTASEYLKWIRKNYLNLSY